MTIVCTGALLWWWWWYDFSFFPSKLYIFLYDEELCGIHSSFWVWFKLYILVIMHCWSCEATQVFLVETYEKRFSLSSPEIFLERPFLHFVEKSYLCRKRRIRKMKKSWQPSAFIFADTMSSSFTQAFQNSVWKSMVVYYPLILPVWVCM